MSKPPSPLLTMQGVLEWSGFECEVVGPHDNPEDLGGYNLVAYKPGENIETIFYFEASGVLYSIEQQ